MAATLTTGAVLQQRWGESWIVGSEAWLFWERLARFQSQFQRQQPQDILLAEVEPIRFLAAFLAACQQPCRVWLTNPQWGLREWEQVAAQCKPDAIVGAIPYQFSRAQSSPSCRPTHLQILIPTGGSSGNVQFAVHTWKTLAASVGGFQQHFSINEVNAYCVLPLFHVSGLMQAMRCLLTGGQLVIQPFPELMQNGAIASLPAPQFLSLVPTQLQRLLSSDRDAVPWLRQFTAILLGGAPAGSRLLKAALDLRLPLAPTYGMTETASQVTTLLPHEFLAGNTSSGRALPHADITIQDEVGTILPPGEIGRVTITARSLALGYWQGAWDVPWTSGDLGYLDEAGYLTVVGRETRLIMTGGEKVLPEEVESAILQTGLVQDVAVLGVPDEDWGERVVAVGVPATKDGAIATLRAALKPLLSPYKIPKAWFSCAALPRNASGKIDRKALREWVMNQATALDAATESTLE